MKKKSIILKKEVVGKLSVGTSGKGLTTDVTTWTSTLTTGI